MDILAQRKSKGELSGQLLLNGQPAAQGAVVRCAAYVPQVCGLFARLCVSQ